MRAGVAYGFYFSVRAGVDGRPNAFDAFTHDVVAAGRSARQPRCRRPAPRPPPVPDTAACRSLDSCRDGSAATRERSSGTPRSARASGRSAAVAGRRAPMVQLTHSC
jgi:hypothetical protein